MSLTDCSLDYYSSLLTYPGVFCAWVSSPILVGYLLALLPVPLLWESLLRGNVINRAESDMQVGVSDDM